MVKFNLSDSLHRLVKQVLDSGKASSLEEAHKIFRGYQLRFHISVSDSLNVHNQAALLTGVALAKRVFLGGVWISGNVDTPISTPLVSELTLREALQNLGGILGEGPVNIPLVSIGEELGASTSPFHVRTIFAGWGGGVAPSNVSQISRTTDTMPLSPMLSAALAVNEAFSYVQTGNSTFGRETRGFSMWKPSELNWLATVCDGPSLSYLPSRLWLIGLGHLGQAYLWGLGLLGYPPTDGLSVTLQDTDIITPSTESTSILSHGKMVGQRKTRAMANWAESRGFVTTIVERQFDSEFQRQTLEPSIALCGVDNEVARLALDKVGFELVIEAGLGRTSNDFRRMRIHTLPSSRKSSEIWRIAETRIESSLSNGYKGLLESHLLDRCGVTMLAGKAVGAPFVGAVAACIVLSEVLRLLHGGPLHELIDLDLESLEQRTVIDHSMDFSTLNPGYSKSTL